MSLNRSSLSARSLIEQIFSSVGLVACAKVNERFNLFQGGSIVHYIDARCVSADDHDLSLLDVE